MRFRFTVKNPENRFVRLTKDSDGSAAIEFAMVVPIFLALLFGILEVGYLFYADAVIESTMDTAARKIMTGNAPDKDYVWDTSDTTAKCRKSGKECFIDDICSVLSFFGDCEENLAIDVEVFSSFGALASDNSAVTCTDNDDYDYDAQKYDDGDQLQIIRIRLCWLYKPLVPGLGIALADTAEGRHQIVSTSIFRTEPYDKEDSSVQD